MFNPDDILYEDNHLLIVNKRCGDLVQPDPSGESALEDQIKAFIKRRDAKPGEVFLGVVHRIDRPVSGAVVFAATLGAGTNYTLVEVELLTGRHHQIRAQLSKVGCPIRGDLKYGARRSLPGGGISLHSRRVEFEPPVRREPHSVTAPVPAGDNLWTYFENL